MKRNGNGRLQALAREMDARFESMGREIHEVRQDMRALDRRFGRMERQFRGLQKSTRGLFHYVEHLDAEQQRHRLDKTAHFPPAR